MTRFVGVGWCLGVVLCVVRAHAEESVADERSPVPAAAEPAPEVRLPTRARVQFSDLHGEHRTIYVRRRDGNDPAAFEELCTTPCKESLPPGSYRFAMTSEADRWFESRTFELRPGLNEVSTEFVDTNARKALGVVVLVVGVTVGVAMQTTKRQTDCHSTCPPSSPTVAGGLAFILGVGLGIPLLAQRDRISFSLYRPTFYSDEPRASRVALPKVAIGERANILPNGATLSFSF